MHHLLVAGHLWACDPLIFYGEMLSTGILVQIVRVTSVVLTRKIISQLEKPVFYSKAVPDG
jgi:diphthamide synthase (EF-2-diphthine--ammonia ligase)